MIAMSTVLEDTNPFETVLGFASMLGEDGRAMHKSWGNSIEFNEGADKIGVDVMRWSFARHNPERNLLFGYKMTSETKRQFHMILWNSYRFFTNLVSLEDWEPNSSLISKNPLDKWILSRLSETVTITTDSLNIFDAFTATSAIENFVSDYSTWYIRRSRDRVGPSATNEEDKNNCYQTMYTVLEVLLRLMAPFTPFMSDLIYTNLTGAESVHLTSWPNISGLTAVDFGLTEQMTLARKICEMGHSQRKLANLAVKQPLANILVLGDDGEKISSFNLSEIILDELNIETISFQKEGELGIKIDTTLTEDLLQKGKAREIIRSIQEARKIANCGLSEKINLILPNWPASMEAEIKRKTLVENLSIGESLQVLKLNAEK